MEPVSINELMYDRGRGPELRSLRITVYDLVPSLLREDYRDETMFQAWPSITPEELAALKQYFMDHRAEVMKKHWEIEEWLRNEQEKCRIKMEKRLGNTTGRLQYFKTWISHREIEAADGGRPLQDSVRERLSEYSVWWRVNGALVNSGQFDWNSCDVAPHFIVEM